VSNPRGDKVDYARTILADAEARRYLAGLSFHSWGGADAETYRAWGNLARRYNLPLFVAEIGWNAMAHKGGSMNTLRYSLEELRIYQELLLYARPQVLLEWEFCRGYPLLLPGEGGQLLPTLRYRIMQHYCTLTPQPATALGTESDNAEVLMTAFRGDAGQGGVSYTVHIANLGAGRDAVLEGLPPTATAVRAVLSGPTAQFQDVGTLAPAQGGLPLQLAPCSLLTLTWTEPGRAQPEM